MAEDAMLEWLGAQADRFSRLSTRHPLSVDLAAGALMLAGSFYGLSTQGRLGRGSVLFGAALLVPLALRRRWPAFTFGLVLVVGFLQWLLSVPQFADAALLVALFCVAEASASLVVIAAVCAVEAGAIAATVSWVVVDPLKIWVGLSALAVAAAGSGVVVRQRRALLESLRERAARLEAERDRQGELAAGAERARIAREMHDIVAHNLTVMIALADGAGYAMAGAPEQARPAIERISATGREALLEMRRLLGVLHEGPGEEPMAPQPSLARLDELLRRVEAAGIPVSVSVSGDPTSLSEGMQLTLFRVAQEALTNTLKHAVNPTRASLALTIAAGGTVALEVRDDGASLVTAAAGAPSAAGRGLAGTGRGLAGMRERAAAYHGTLEAGPAPEGGWRVALSLSG